MFTLGYIIDNELNYI